MIARVLAITASCGTLGRGSLMAASTCLLNHASCPDSDCWCWSTYVRMKSRNTCAAGRSASSVAALKAAFRSAGTRKLKLSSLGWALVRGILISPSVARIMSLHYRCKPIQLSLAQLARSSWVSPDLRFSRTWNPVGRGIFASARSSSTHSAPGFSHPPAAALANAFSPSPFP